MTKCGSVVTFSAEGFTTGSLPFGALIWEIYPPNLPLHSLFAHSFSQNGLFIWFDIKSSGSIIIKATSTTSSTNSSIPSSVYIGCSCSWTC